MKRVPKRPALAALWLASALIASVGCKHDRPKRVAASYSSVTKPSALRLPQRAPERAPVGIDSIPTEEEYEERAEKTITEANALQQLSLLEKEMTL